MADLSVEELRVLYTMRRLLPDGPHAPLWTGDIRQHLLSPHAGLEDDVVEVCIERLRGRGLVMQTQTGVEATGTVPNNVSATGGGFKLTLLGRTVFDLAAAGGWDLADSASSE